MEEKRYCIHSWKKLFSMLKDGQKIKKKDGCCLVYQWNVAQ